MPASSPIRSLKTQIALVFGSLVIVVVTGLTVVLGGMLSTRIRHDTEASLRLTADSVSATLQRNLAYRSKQAVVMGQSESLWSGGLDSRPAAAALRRVHDYQPENRRVEVADTEGRVRAAAPHQRVGQDVRSREWFDRGLQGTAISIQVESAPPAGSGGGGAQGVAGDSFVVFSAPVVVESRTVGVVAVHTGWSWVQSAIEQYLPPDARELALDVAVFDRDGSLLHAVGPQAGALRAAGQTRPRVESAPSSVRWADGRDYLTAISPVRAAQADTDLGWTVVVRRPAREAYSDARHAIAMTLSIGLLAAIASAAIAFLAARRISGDLSRIVEALRDVENGVPGATIPSLDSSKETRILSQALQRVTTRLLRARQEMEAQVRLRTLELEAANRELDLQARSDPLTGLFNRRGLSDHLDPALALAARGERPLSIVVLDADHFKRVNDRYGHVVGDDVLRHLAFTLRQRLRASDVAARVGGEEFVVLLPDTEVTGAEPLAQQLIEHVAAHPHPVCGPLTLSAGVAGFRAGDDAQSLFRRADRALYAAKAAGRNRVCVAAPFDSDADGA